MIFIATWEKTIEEERQIKPLCSSEYTVFSLQHEADIHYAKPTWLHKRLNNMWWPGQRVRQATTVNHRYMNVLCFIWTAQNSSHMIKAAADTLSFTEPDGVINTTNVGQGFMGRKTTVYLNTQAYTHTKENHACLQRPRLCCEMRQFWLSVKANRRCSELGGTAL